MATNDARADNAHDPTDRIAHDDWTECDDCGYDMLVDFATCLFCGAEVA